MYEFLQFIHEVKSQPDTPLSVIGAGLILFGCLMVLVGCMRSSAKSRPYDSSHDERYVCEITAMRDLLDK